MANLQVKGMDDTFYEALKAMARRKGRSLSQQVTIMLKDYMAREEGLEGVKRPAELLLDLAGSWEDERPAREIVEEIRRARRSSEKLKEGWDVSA